MTSEDTPKKDAHPFDVSMRVTMFLGAALEDADLIQRQAMKEVVPTLLEDFDAHTGSTAEAAQPIFDAIQKVMGEQWEPTGQWATYVGRWGMAPAPGSSS